MKTCLFFLLSILPLGVVLAAPSENSFIVSPTKASTTEEMAAITANSSLQQPKIYEMEITSNISNRYATTLIVSRVKNVEKAATETNFTVVLPDKAFISEFVMEIDGTSYKAYVKEKEEAKQIYNQAVASGQSAGHVAVSARDSNKFTVSVNVVPEAKIAFLLTYEELLERRNGQYEQIVNIRPGQIVKDLNVKVQIDESRPLKFVRTPSLRSGNEISKNEDKLDPSSDIQIVNKTSAVVTFTPDSEKQRQFAQELGDKESDGLSGQFVVQYDVERDPNGGEVLLRDGYFVHFFAPEDLEPLPKHVLFVLDSSGSMYGRKLDQVKDAMHSILDEMKEDDLISVIDFGNDVNVWDINGENITTIDLKGLEYENPFAKLSDLQLPAPTKATKDNLEKAKRLTDQFYSFGGTFMIGGLETALYLANRTYQPIMIFLTDGQPNTGLRSTEEITKIVTRLNSELNIPIFSLSFGRGADKEFLKKLSLKNQGFSRHIYEASDASLQLQEFYKQISSPLLSNVTFKYNDDVKDVSRTTFPVFFKGSEIAVAGRYHVLDSDFEAPEEVTGWDIEAPKTLKPTVQTSATSLERLWAYLTVKQTLDERELSENKDKLKKKALELALKYSFVTDVTSLVVVKPNETSAIDTEDAFTDDGYYETSAVYKYHSTPSFAHVGFSSLGSAGPAHHGLTTFGKSPPPVPSVQLAANADLYNATLPDASRTLSGTTIVPSQNESSWLVSAISPNRTITIAEKSYKLGAGHDVASPELCTNSWSNNTSHCLLFIDCPEMLSVVKDFLTFQQYFCPIEEKYAGICCPTKVE